MSPKRWLSQFLSRRRADRDTDITRELQAHLDLESEEFLHRGLSQQESEFAARRSLGNEMRIHEELHTVWTSVFWEQAKQDTRFALRTLARNPGFTAVALLSLALGIGANTAIFTFVNAAFLKPLPYPDADRIVVLRERPRTGGDTTAAHPRGFVHWQQRSQSFEALALAQAIPLNTDGLDGAEQIPGLWVSPGLFHALGVRPMLGQDFTAGQGLTRENVRAGSAREVILSYPYWQRRFGRDPAIIGKTIAAGRGSAIVVGVMPAGFRVGFLNVDVYTPMWIDPARPDAVGSRSFLCIGLLRRGISLQSARAEMDTIGTQVSREEPVEKDFAVAILTLRQYLVGEHRSTLFLLAGAVALILLIACANLAGLLLTRGLGRHSELSVRAALGAGRWRIVQQLVVESLLLSTIGGALGLCLGWAGSRALAALAETAVDFGQLSEVSLDIRVFAFTAILVFFTAILFGFLPAWRVSQIDLQSSAKSLSRGSLGAGPGQTRSLLVIVEVALAVVLLVAGGLLVRSYDKLSNVRLGFQPENVLTMRTLIMGDTGFRANLSNAILERVESLPGVRAAGTIQFLPLAGWTNQGPFHFVGQPRPVEPAAMESDVSTVSRGYFAAIGMELLRGREFARQDRFDGPRVALVNQAFVTKYSSGEDPIGRIILGDWSNPKPTEIIGVVNNVRHSGLAAEPRPTIFLSQAQVPGYFTNLVVRTHVEPETMASTIRREVRQVDPKQPFTDIQAMHHYVSRQLSRPRLYANFVGWFAALALILAAVGLYGLLAYEVSQRRREIGLRMALGARPKDVVTTTMWHGLRLVLAGIALGSLAASALAALITKLLYGVKPSDPFTYLSVAAALIIVAIVATIVPARRAARVDPLVALRCD